MNLVLYSKRLALVPLDETDIDITVEMFTDPDVLRFAGGVMSEADIHRDMHVWTRRGGNGCIGIWCVSDRDSGEKFGSAALLPMPVEGDDTDFDLVVPGQMPEGDVEVGYFLKRSAWGKGYATEACKRILRMAFEDSPLTEVVATFEKGNSASQNVLEKAGFVDRGVMRCYGEDGPNFRITRDEWVRMQRSGRAT
jgi:RimJ/RimL family protein N-acetyltransferase